MSSSSKKRKCYDASYKLKVVECAENSSKEGAAREFSVDPKRIRVWCSQKDQLKALKKEKRSTRKRLDGARRKPSDVEMEEALFEWIVDLRSHHLCVSCRMIRMQAKMLCTDNGFKASHGWLERFIKRHALSLRRKTTISQAVPSDVIKITRCYFTIAGYIMQ